MTFNVNYFSAEDGIQEMVFDVMALPTGMLVNDL